MAELILDAWNIRGHGNFVGGCSGQDAGQINEKVALVNVADSFGIELVNAGKPALEAAGFDIVYETSYPLQQQDFAPIISGAKNAAPDTFVAFSYLCDTFGLTKQAAIANLPVKAFYVGVATAFAAFAAANRRKHQPGSSRGWMKVQWPVKGLRARQAWRQVVHGNLYRNPLDHA